VVETQVLVKEGILDHHHLHHQEEEMWEQATKEKERVDIMKEE
jgi:hypothetical protein